MDVLNRPAEEFENDGMVEELWAMKAFDHAEVYFNLISSCDPRALHLSPFDDQIYTTFRQDFPTLNIGLLDENEMKSPVAKEKWRKFIEKFNKLEDFGFGSLIRINAGEDFGENNSMLVVRIQFLAIEIARNREGYNDKIYKKYAKAREEDVAQG
uniref:CSON009352 protein n=1 Tax=Culicoides sonorensis TaxID=179676 RepID=A0A336LKX6_CULSO